MKASSFRGKLAIKLGLDFVLRGFMCSGSRKGVKHRACGAGDHTSAGRQVVQEQPDRILQPDRNITLEDIKGRLGVIN